VCVAHQACDVVDAISNGIHGATAGGFMPIADANNTLRNGEKERSVRAEKGA
jgi:hypothetical protein